MKPPEIKTEGNQTTGSPQPEIIDAQQVLKTKSLKPYHEVKDHRITSLAIWVIAGAAAVSGIALLWQLLVPVCSADKVCIMRELPDWPAETLRLALVASLAFVMGSGGKQS